MSQAPRWRSVVSRTSTAAAAALGAFALLFAGNEAAPGPRQSAKPNRYIGAAKCKSCHKAEKSGNQYGAWEKMKHASAFEVLASDEAKRIGKERGIPDPQKSAECLKCHTTAFGEPAEAVKKRFKMELGVQCESCHGPGEKHLKVRFAAAATAEEGAEVVYTQIPADEIVSSPPMKTCLRCHNEESPGFERFCFHEFLPKIRHLNPRKPRTKEQLADMLVCGCGDPCPCTNGCPEDGCGVPQGAPKDG